MKLFWHRIEVLVDKLIPLMLVILLMIIIIEIFYPSTAHDYEKIINIADDVIVSIFIADLIFKYNRVKNIPKFIRFFWLDILAVFPFFLVFRMFEGAIQLFSSISIETAEGVQKVIHEGLEVEKEIVKVSEGIGKATKEGEIVAKEASKIVKEVEGTGKISRSRMITRFIRPIARMPRLLKAFTFFEHPTVSHHLKKRRRYR